MANDLEPYENITRVFWIKVERKEKQKAGKQNLGEIRDVRSGEKCQITGMGDVINFMIPHMRNMGIEIHWFWQFLCWVKRSKKS